MFSQKTMGKPNIAKLMEAMSNPSEDVDDEDESVVESDGEPQFNLIEPPVKTVGKRPAKQTRAPRKRVAKVKLDPNGERVFPNISSDEELIYRNKIGNII